MLAVTWTRNDSEKYWGPFTWAPEQSSSGWGVHIKSSKDETGDDGPSYLRIGLGKRSILVRTPDWLIKPVRKRHYVTTFSEEQLQEYMARNGGRDWYWEYYPREYGFMFHEDSLHFHYGVQNLSWGGPDGSKSGVRFYPWLGRRRVRDDWYDTEGRFFAHVPRLNHETWEERRALEATVPVKKFAFKDYDGEVIVATLRLGETEYARGERRGWRWLSYFVKNEVYRSFDIQFSSEVGPEKGSWKGGVTGHSIKSEDPTELHEAAFRRYCEERSQDRRRSKHDAPMTFLHEVI